MLTAAQAAGDWDTAWSLVHPDALKYTTKAAFIKDMQYDINRGYQLVSTDIGQTTIVKWTLPKCPVAAFGPNVYPETAAISVTYHYSAPAGRAQDTPGISHLVKGPDGRWRWFPTTGCDHKPGQAQQAP